MTVAAIFEKIRSGELSREAAIRELDKIERKPWWQRFINAIFGI